jgi:hypothetical protein
MNNETGRDDGSAGWCECERKGPDGPSAADAPTRVSHMTVRRLKRPVRPLRTAAVVAKIEANATQMVIHNESCRSLATAP